MKKLTKIISSALVIGVLAASSITSFASTPPNTAVPAEFSNRRGMQREDCEFKDIDKSDLTEEQKSQIVNRMKERLAQQLKDGNITQERYDEVMKDIAEGKRPGFLGGNKPGRGQGRKGQDEKGQGKRGQGGLGNRQRQKSTDQ